MIASNSLQDEMLKAYIESVFNKYDADRNGSLDVKEMTMFFNDLFRNLNIPVVVTEAQSLQAIKSIDENSDGLVDRQELFKAFKMMLNPKPNPQTPPPTYGQGNNPYGNNMQQSQGYNPPNYPNQGYNNQGYNPQSYGYNNNYPQGYGANYPNQGGYLNTPTYNGNSMSQNYNPNPMYGTQTRNVPMYNTQPYQQNYNPYR